MNKYLKDFLLRGLAFSGFGPIILGVVLACIDLSGVEIALSGSQVLLGVISTYLLAFVQAGASVFNQIEHWSLAKSTGLHFLSLYVVYVLCYVVNNWIPFEWGVIGIFTAIFAVGYFVVWFTVYMIVKSTSKKLNQSIAKNK
ncbi:MAG: DUF3021 domain-containing protein [Clostridia bacterium]|nr:DUF3021 domain-containing protein [Clostridia bacterium]